MAVNPLQAEFKSGHHWVVNKIWEYRGNSAKHSQGILFSRQKTHPRRNRHALDERANRKAP
jgi:hypothetical protein